MYQLAIVRALAVLSLGSLCSGAAVINQRDDDLLNEASFKDVSSSIQPVVNKRDDHTFDLSARNVIKSDTTEIPGGIAVNWTASTNLTSKLTCITGDDPAYFATSNIGYFAVDACNTMMNGRHGPGLEFQPPGRYVYKSPAYQDTTTNNPHVAMMITLDLWDQPLDFNSIYTCQWMMSHISQDPGGWCVTTTNKHPGMTQGGQVEIYNTISGKKKSWYQSWFGPADTLLMRMKWDPAMCKESGDPCSNTIDIGDSSLNSVMASATLGASPVPRQTTTDAIVGQNE